MISELVRNSVLMRAIELALPNHHQAFDAFKLKKALAEDPASSSLSEDVIDQALDAACDEGWIRGTRTGFKVLDGGWLWYLAAPGNEALYEQTPRKLLDYVKSAAPAYNEALLPLGLQQATGTPPALLYFYIDGWERRGLIRSQQGGAFFLTPRGRQHFGLD